MTFEFVSHVDGDDRGIVGAEFDEHMLGLTSLSGLSRDSSSIAQDVDLDLVEQMIEKAPRSATTFPLVYKAYGEVLEQRYVPII